MVAPGECWTASDSQEVARRQRYGPLTNGPLTNGLLH